MEHFSLTCNFVSVFSLKIAHWADKFSIDAFENYIMYDYIVETTSSIKNENDTKLARNRKINDLIWITWLGWPIQISLYLDMFVLQTLSWKVG